MPELILTDVKETVLDGLQQRAAGHGRTKEEEAKVILSEALEDREQTGWQRVDEIYHRLASMQHVHSDSADLLREDRDR